MARLSPIADALLAKRIERDFRQAPLSHRSSRSANGPIFSPSGWLGNSHARPFTPSINQVHKDIELWQQLADTGEQETRVVEDPNQPLELSQKPSTHTFTTRDLRRDANSRDATWRVDPDEVLLQKPRALEGSASEATLTGSQKRQITVEMPITSGGEESVLAASASTSALNTQHKPRRRVRQISSSSLSQPQFITNHVMRLEVPTAPTKPTPSVPSPAQPAQDASSTPAPTEPTVISPSSHEALTEPAACPSSSSPPTSSSSPSRSRGVRPTLT